MKKHRLCYLVQQQLRFWIMYSGIRWWIFQNSFGQFWNEQLYWMERVLQLELFCRSLLNLSHILQLFCPNIQRRRRKRSRWWQFWMIAKTSVWRQFMVTLICLIYNSLEKICRNQQSLVHASISARCQIAKMFLKMMFWQTATTSQSCTEEWENCVKICTGCVTSSFMEKVGVPHVH